MNPSLIPALLRIEALALGMAVLFVLAGRAAIDRFLLPGGAARSRPWIGAYGESFFVGLALFLACFVLGASLVHSARVGLWLALGMLFSGAVWAPRARASGNAWGRLSTAVLVLLGLVVFFTFTNATAWLGPNNVHELRPWHHFFSIHSGRYADYALVVVDQDRIPRIPQNMGQSLLSASLLLLGSHSPLAALAVWIPISLAALTAQIYGVLSHLGLPGRWAALGTFVVLYCNVALSTASHFLLDNGFPLGVIGYTDAIIGLGTFLVFCKVVVGLLVRWRKPPLAGAPSASLLGLVWAWCAPQNVVIAGVVVVALAAAWAHRLRDVKAGVRFLLPIAAGLGMGAALGATQFGPFLPASLHEDVGVDIHLPGPLVRIRPYAAYLVRHWSDPPLVGDHLGMPDLYDVPWREALATGGPWQAWTAMLGIFARKVWESCRLYALLPFGALLLRRHSLARPGHDLAAPTVRLWADIALATFFVGYGVAFFVELDSIKWWLLRFLLPAMLCGLLAVVVAFSPRAGTRSPAHWFFLLPTLLTVPSLVELASAFHLTWIEPSASTLWKCLDVLVTNPGPFRYRP